MGLEKGEGQGRGKFTKAGIQKAQEEAIDDLENAVVELSERLDALEAGGGEEPTP
jgi:uncharacterized protein YceH (UPF0502 family)